MEVGLCGLGAMGSAFAARLIERGHRVTVWNRTAAKADKIAGAMRAETPAAVAAGHTIVLTSLLDGAAIAAVYEGAGGLLAAAQPGTLFVDLSTLAPGFTRDLAARLAARGMRFLECPVGGTPAAAREGRVVGMAGGKPEDFARARPLLGDLCRRVEHFGEVGAGSAMKLAVNLPLLVYWEALGEALSLIRDCAIDPGLAIDVIAESSGGPNVLKQRGAWVVEALRSGKQPSGGFYIDGARKDLRATIEVARGMGFALPVAEEALRCYDVASSEGWGRNENCMMTLYRVDKAKAAKG